MINEFVEKESEIFKETKIIYKDRENVEDADYDLLVDKLEMMKKTFYNMIGQTWHTVMESEIQLFENIEEANTQFGHIVQEMLNGFIEQAQTLFVQIRHAEGNFSDSIFEIVSRFITNKAAAGDIEAIPAELHEVTIYYFI